MYMFYYRLVFEMTKYTNTHTKQFKQIINQLLRFFMIL